MSDNDPTSVDYGARDQRIRCQTYSPVRKKRGLPHELFAAYWRDIHGPLCSRLPGLGYYVQYHFASEPGKLLWPFAKTTRPIDGATDGAVEIGFANLADQDRFIAASPVLFGDEINLFEADNAYLLPAGSQTLIDRLKDDTPNGSESLYRLHVLFHGLSDTFRPTVSQFASFLASLPETVRVRLHQPEPYDNASPAPPSPDVDHWLPDERLNVCIMDVAFESALVAREIYLKPNFLAAKSKLDKEVLAGISFLVTGVYTFVRDGKLTLAGLRGSRSAEIIQSMGAINHVQPDIVEMFMPHSRRPEGVSA